MSENSTHNRLCEVFMSPAIILSIVLVVMGVGGYVATGMASVTALIPAFFGAAIFAVQKLPKANIISIVLAVLGMGGSGGGLPGMFKVMTGNGSEVERPAAAVIRGLMFLACLVFVLVTVLRKKKD